METTLKSRPFDVTHRSVFKIAVPMTLAYMSTPILGIVDTAVIGQLGVPALLGGIAIGAVLFDVIFTTFNFLRSGTTGLVAQAFGAGNTCEINATFVRAMLIAIVLGLIVIIVQAPFIALGLAAMGASEQVGDASALYLSIRIYSAPFGLANFVILGWFLGLGKAGTGLLLQVLLNGLNIVLNVTFVLVFEWGVAGIALGTVIGEIVTTFIGLGLVLRETGFRNWPSWARVTDWVQFKRIAALNGDIMVRSFVLLFAFSFFTAQSARFDDITLAANAVLMHFFMISGYFLDGFATAAEQLAGRAVGARWKPAFIRTVSMTLKFGLLLSVSLFLVFWMVGPVMIDLITTSQPVRDVARTYLIWAALTPIAGVLAFQMDGIFIGATWSRDMRNMMLVSIAVYLGSWWLLKEPFGIHGLWMALLIFLGARGFSLAFMCRKRARETFG